MGLKVEGAKALRSKLAARKQAASDPGALDAFLQALANMGARRAQLLFNDAYYSGINDVTVEPVRDSPGTYEVVARGTSVMFIEFGSGVTYSHDNPNQPAGWAGGSWSEANMNAIRRDGLWVYRGQPGGDASPVLGKPANTWWTRGTPSANAMYEAGKDMRDGIAETWARYMGYSGGGE